MDRYQRVEKPRPETPIKNEIRITPQGRIRNYIIYATALFQILDPFGDGLCLYLLDMLCIEKGIRDNCFHEVAFPCFKTLTPRSVYNAIGKSRYIKLSSQNSEHPDLGNVRVVVTGGRALKSAENFKMIEKLVEKLGAAVEATLAAVDARFVFDDIQDTWEELDPDELSYEELLALGEVVRTESRGLSFDTIASLPSVNYKT